MSIKSILCPFHSESQDLHSLHAAFAITRATRSALRIVHFAVPPALYHETLETTGIAARDGLPLGDILESDALVLADTAREYASSYATHHGLVLEQDGVGAIAGEPRVVFRTVIGSPAECLPREGRSVDLVVSACDSRAEGGLDIVLTALFRTGAPVLVYPRAAGALVSVAGRSGTVVVAWDGSLASSRALRAAILHMAHAQKVYVVQVEALDAPFDPAAEANVRDYLHSHGVTAQFVHCAVHRHGIGHSLLEKAGDLGADLLVMGAYGHGHIGEMILGGVSNHVLKTANLPLLLAH